MTDIYIYTKIGANSIIGIKYPWNGHDIYEISKKNMGWRGSRDPI